MIAACARGRMSAMGRKRALSYRGVGPPVSAWQPASRPPANGQEPAPVLLLRLPRRRRAPQAEAPHGLVEQGYRLFEGPALSAAAGREAAVDAAGLAVPAGEELHDAVEIRVGVA